MLREGPPRLVVMCVLGAFGAQELHHVVESLADGGYDPGVITCIPYAIVGCLLVQSVWREFQRGRGGGWRPGACSPADRLAGGAHGQRRVRWAVPWPSG